MQVENPKRTEVLVRRLFEVLLDIPSGMPIGDILDQMDSNRDRKQRVRLFEMVMRGCIAPIKAGWLQNDGYYLAVSEEGKRAFERYPDPSEFLAEAGKLSVRGRISLQFPRSYYFLAKSKDRLTSEFRAVRRIGIRQLLSKAIGKRTTWQETLPIQSPRRISLSNPDQADLNWLPQYLDGAGLSYGRGGHAIYLPPETLKKSTNFIGLADSYPANAGLKIIKERGGVSESTYVTNVSKGDSRLHLRLIHNPRHLTLVANLLYRTGIGPRLIDLVELEIDGQLWTAFVVEHVTGPAPNLDECEKGIARIRKLEEEGLMKVILPQGFRDEELACPSCMGNALVNEKGEFKYVDFQNFALVDYDSYLKSIAVKASSVSHFGDICTLRGGRYLYQSVPGVNLPSKRSVDVRMKLLANLMERAKISIRDRLVLDVGCNIGMMMAQYLKLGALWCHGWDRSQITPYTEELLLALGCTRFSTSGVDITKTRKLEDDIDSFLRPHLRGCAISYLAIRGHVGWLDALARIPWGVLIYEGHEGETLADFDHHIEELGRMTKFHIAATAEYADGDSDPRIVAILLKN